MTTKLTSQVLTRRVFSPKRDEALAALSASVEAQQAEHRECVAAFWFGQEKTAQRLDGVLRGMRGEAA